MDRSIERTAPFFWPVIVGLILLAVAIAVVFGIMAYRHLPWGFSELSLSNTGNVGQFIGGTVGTLFAAISSLLLVITLWVQINEYRLTRQELQQTVKAQQDMARSAAEQLAPLKEQANVSRQVMEMDLLSRAVLDLKEDMRRFESEGATTSTGVAVVIPMICNTLNTGSLFWVWINDTKEERQVNNHIGWISRTLLRFSILLERAELIHNDLEKRELPGTASRIRRKELVLFVNNECRDLVHALFALNQMLFLVPSGHTHLLDRFKEKNTARLEACMNRLMTFSKIEVEKF